MIKATRDQTRVRATVRMFAQNTTRMEHPHRRKVLAYRFFAMLNPDQSNSVDNGLCQRKYRILRALIGESIMTVHEALHSRVEINSGRRGLQNGMGS